MTVRTGREYTDGLRDKREVWYGGQRVPDVTSFEEFRPTIDAFADLYDMQHKPELAQTLVVESTTLNEPIGRAF